MITRDQWRRFTDSRPMQLTLFVLGLLMIIASPLLGPLPGPGGILLFGAGLSLVLKTSLWAKRHYVRFKRRRPRVGRWTDWGLRRQSHRRREALVKERQRREAPPRHCVERIDDPLPSSGMEVAPIDPTPTALAPRPPVGEALKR